MNPEQLGASRSGESPQNAFPEIVSNAIRYWERRRIAYNAILAAIVVAWVAASWPHFLPTFKWESLVLLAILAVWANICYCAAYVADVPMQFSVFRKGWLRWRWGLWTFGMLFAVLLANYWIADEIFPYVR
ncbi:MAG: hypothetical protein KGL75_12285 [Acidobacteriota bacterium]|nr:hypothetical protein [Acidobacteriota bacterium]